MGIKTRVYRALPNMLSYPLIKRPAFNTDSYLKVPLAERISRAHRSIRTLIIS